MQRLGCITHTFLWSLSKRPKVPKVRSACEDVPRKHRRASLPHLPPPLPSSSKWHRRCTFGPSAVINQAFHLHDHSIQRISCYDHNVRLIRRYYRSYTEVSFLHVPPPIVARTTSGHARRWWSRGRKTSAWAAFAARLREIGGRDALTTLGCLGLGTRARPPSAHSHASGCLRARATALGKLGECAIVPESDYDDVVWAGATTSQGRSLFSAACPTC
ncbi:hypothetical protein OH76DRAFT_843896 [Lentinus brumalis]|uniref:Uncharacterized protein n=1 Tax=Lentinus brumalis TaxID=2498619 RepID=A0A371DQL9_9APHY|nr:hypothetical protein OH76DRAFT_843896 [Polyporus brumalis]